MNNNRNNRRRGRNNNRNQGGGNSANRIDSRARGNAPQLLDKYKKLAQDAQHHGDRVQAEYYLQFADHYFRVIADNKARQDEAKAKRQDGRGNSDDDSDDDDDGQDDRRGNKRRSRGRRDDRDQANSRQDQGDEGDRVEPQDNPFAADAGGEKPKKRAPRRKKADAPANGEIDVAALPPAIGGSDADAEDKPAPRRRRRKADDEGEGGSDTLSIAS